MIYTKRTNFPYPLLISKSSSYRDADFTFDTELKSNTDNYYFTVKYNISSDFIKSLLSEGRAKLVLIIRSKDNQFHEIKYEETPVVAIKISRLALNARTTLQLMIITEEEVSFEDNNDLDSFYDLTKKDIVVGKGQVLGFSNPVVFNEEKPKTYDLFEKKVDPTIKSKIKIEVGDETIVIYYQSEELQFNDQRYNKELNYPYLYTGLQQALTTFILNNCNDKSNPEEGVDIENMAEPIKELDVKLYDLMTAKNVKELNFDNIDEVIHNISSNLVTRWTDAIRGLTNED